MREIQVISSSRNPDGRAIANTSSARPREVVVHAVTILSNSVLSKRGSLATARSDATISATDLAKTCFGSRRILRRCCQKEKRTAQGANRATIANCLTLAGKILLAALSLKSGALLTMPRAVTLS